MPLVSLFVGLVAFAFALSFYDWPDVFDDMPWSDPKPAVPFVMPRAADDQSYGFPVPPSPSAPSSAPKPVAAMPKPPRGAPPPSNPVVAQAQAPAPIPVPMPVQTPSPTPLPTPLPTPAPVVAEVQPIARPEPEAKPVPRPEVTAAVTSPPMVRPAPIAAPAPVAAPVARAPAAEPQLSATLVALLLRRGDEQAAIGDISAARLLYERAAESGSAPAARQLARTYDSAFLPPATEGTLANAARAKFWYERAAALGLKTSNQGR